MSLRPYMAELFATFCLVLVSAGAVVVDAHVSGHPLGHVGMCLAAGLIVMAMVCCVGDVSGAHLNPAVTIAFWAAGRLPFRYVPGYVIAQLAGSILAAAVLLAMLDPVHTLGETIPRLPPANAFAVEVVTSLILMYVILCVATGAKEKGLIAGLAIGGTVMLNCLWAGPLTGAAMNPARTLGPNIFSPIADAWTHLWLYGTAPVIGASLAVIVCRMTHPPGACCTTGSTS